MAEVLDNTEVRASESADKRNDKDYNFAALRKKEELNRAEIARLKSELEESRSAAGTYQALQEAGVDPDHFVEGKHVAKILNAESKKSAQGLDDKIASIIDSRLKEYQDKHAFSYLQAETQGKFGQVVNEDSVKEWAGANPLVFNTITRIDDPIERRVAMMEAISNFQTSRSNIKQMEERLQELQKTGALHPQDYAMALDNGTMSKEQFIKTVRMPSHLSDEHKLKILQQHNEFLKDPALAPKYFQLMRPRIDSVKNSGGIAPLR